MKKQCRHCKTEMNLIQKDVAHSIFGKSIEVKGVPLYVCQTCNREEYVHEQKVEHKIRDAYRMNILSVHFEDSDDQ